MVELRFYFGHYWGQQQQQQQQTNNMMMSSCIFGKLLPTFVHGCLQQYWGSFRMSFGEGV
jgi:hypothetical protein